MLKTKRQIFATAQNTNFRLSEIMFEDQSPSLSIRGYPCSNQQFILPIKSEKIHRFWAHLRFNTVNF